MNLCAEDKSPLLRRGLQKKIPTSHSASQVSRNLATNIVVVVVRTVVGIWLTKYLIDTLGMAVYGVVPLVISLTAYLNPITGALNTAVGRYLTIDIRNEDYLSANRTFNTAFWLSIGISLLLMPIVVAFSLAAPRIFNVPAGHEEAVVWLFLLSMIAYLIVYIKSNFLVSAFVQNRLDIQNAVTLVYVVVRVLIIVLLFSVTLPSLFDIGYASLFAALATLLLSIYVWRKLTPQLVINLSFFDRTRLRGVLGTSSWVTINLVGSLLYLSVELVIVNIHLGPVVSGGYGSVLQWSVLLRTLAQAMAGILSPIIIAQYARRDLAGVAALSTASVKLLGLTMALMAGGLVGFSHTLLDVWLGPEFVYLAPLLIVLVSHLCINLAVIPLFHVQVALNKVKWPALITLALGALNVILSIYWVDALPLGMGVALIGAIILSAKNIVFTPVYGAHILGIPWTTYFKPLLIVVISFVGVAAVSYLVAASGVVDSWLTLAAAGATIAVGFLVLTYGVLLNQSERDFARRLLPL
jgi:membrane protein EpsK